MHLLLWLLAGSLAAQAVALGSSNLPRLKVKPYKRELLQDIVTWDQHSIFVHGKRVLFYSGEFHPFRLPVPGLWLDVFQKIRAMGYTGVSFYTDWGLLEGKPGSFSAEGVFALEPFFEAAQQAGIYLLARPGPYINAEASGGGFPGWLQRVSGRLRTSDKGYLDASELYVKSIGEIMAKAQITNGGPVILFQPENELYHCLDPAICSEPVYMAYVEEQFRRSGIVVPYMVNDNFQGNFAPRKPAAMDIYGFDNYPLLFDCANPQEWPNNDEPIHNHGLPTYYTANHTLHSPLTPFSIPEFQGGSFDPWGGWGNEQCVELVNAEFVRVFFKNTFAAGISIFNVYMTFGGTNWGNLGHPLGYTSYDYAAVIRENLLVDREKYSEAKLEATFLTSSPAYITATPGNLTNGTYTDTMDVNVTPLWGNGSDTNFYVVRHTNYSTFNTASYKLKVTTSAGPVVIPQLGGSLSLPGRDSKVHVTDYKLGKHNLLYSSAEIFTWKSYGNLTVLVVYGGAEETHELAVSGSCTAKAVEGDGAQVKQLGGATMLNWKTSTTRQVVRLDSGLTIYILDRNAAYNYWVLKVPDENGLYTPTWTAGIVIVKAGYLMRNATVSSCGKTLDLVGDFNATTSIEIIGGAPPRLTKLNINGKSVDFQQDDHGVVKAIVDVNIPDIHLPSLSTLRWKYLDTLPEIQADYDDSAWRVADLASTHSDTYKQQTPTSLFATDYGFNTGYLLFRGHFTANGNEDNLFLETQGGNAFSSSVWLSNTYLGSFQGFDAARSANSIYPIPSKLTAGQAYVITVVIDQMGMNQNKNVDENLMKEPRGILRYALGGHSDAADVTWKLTGNLGGEDHLDKVRGPLNEGGLWAERQGYHLPGAPYDDWEDSAGPTKGLSGPGIGWYALRFDLDLPRGWDIPLSVTLTNATGTAYRVQLYVNGWQFGKYVGNIGPQRSFPVPQGIWNYQGTNYVALSLWSLEKGGAAIEGLELTANATILSGYGDVPLAPQSTWTRREDAY